MRPLVRHAWIAGALTSVVLVGAAMSSGAEAEPAADGTPATRPIRATSLDTSLDTARATLSTANQDPRRARLIPPTADLWTPQDAVPPGEHGELIQAQRVVPTPSGLGSAYRVLYRSETPDGRPVHVSGVVYVPRGPAPDRGWPVISWARGTTGTADRCAPSRAVGEDTVPIDLARAGFLVTATDYQGLGTPGLQPYLVGDSEGRAVLDIVRAAEGLPAVTARRTVALWGHSQGGHAVLFARQLAASWLPGRPVAGTVAMAPPAFIPQIVGTWLKVPAKALGLMALAGLAETDADARLEDVIAPEYLPALRTALASGCTEDVNRAFASVSPAALFISDPTMTMPWAALLHAQEPAQQPGSGPTLLVHGDLDATLPMSMSQAIETQMCRDDEPVERWVLPGQGHGEIIGGAWTEMVAWTRDRFRGQPPPSTTCSAVDDPMPS